MENEIFGISMPILSQTTGAMEGSSPHVGPGVIMPTDALTNNSQTYLIGGYPLFSTLQEEAINSLHITGDVNAVSSQMGASSRLMSLPSSAFGNPDLREHLEESTLSAASIASLLSGPPSSIPAEDIRASFISNGCCNRLNSSLSASDNCAFGAEDDAGILAPGRAVSGSNVRWGYDEHVGRQMLQARSLATVGPSYRVSSGSDSAWVSSKSSLISDDQYTYSVPGNELSLTLGSPQQSAMNIASVPDQCSEMSCSGITQVTSKDNSYRKAAELQVSSQFLRHPSYEVGRALGLESKHPFPGNEERALECGSSGCVHFSQTLLGSQYLHVAHQILAEVAGRALEDRHKSDDSGYLCERGSSPLRSDEFRHDSADIRAHEPTTVKAELITMLQMVCQRCPSRI